MNTNELVCRIDESIETGMGILAGRSSEGADRKEDSDGIKTFCLEVKGLIEEIYGGGNHLSCQFGESDGYDPEMVKKGLAVLKDLRRVTIYSGEFSS
ncbi:MAG TPA: hypothetical protein VFG19_04120 [Geobacteraceae bacterium]|nr:hypothetical protein [Geobacteraceae bacterium]